MAKMFCKNCRSVNLTLINSGVNAKTKYRTTVNLNPLRPFTVVNTKAVTKTKRSMITGGRQALKHDFLCNDCGYLSRLREGMNVGNIGSSIRAEEREEALYGGSGGYSRPVSKANPQEVKETVAVILAIVIVILISPSFLTPLLDSWNAAWWVRVIVWILSAVLIFGTILEGIIKPIEQKLKQPKETDEETPKPE